MSRGLGYRKADDERKGEAEQKVGKSPGLYIPEDIALDMTIPLMEQIVREDRLGRRVGLEAKVQRPQTI